MSMLRGRALAALLAALAPLPPFARAHEEAPLTTAEASAYARTSTHADVLAFLEALGALPHAGRLRVETFGHSEEGRALPLVIAAEPLPADERDLASGGKLRVLVVANIHGGEVEGKEAVQILLRELARGEHAHLLEDLILLFVPIYNADGNDRIERANRAQQNGPREGVGERANARGLDLNRDFVKAESAECRALLGLLRRFDPHLFLDLHTTNGSPHGYHLTYSPSLSTNVDPRIDAFTRGTLLPRIAAGARERHGLRSFHYGNLDRGTPPRWVTYDHRPRFGTNYVGLRGRFSILSEAFSYVDFETRVRATRAFVLETLAVFAEHAEQVAALCAAADARLVEDGPPARFRFDTRLAAPVVQEVLVDRIERQPWPDGEGERRVAAGEPRAETMEVQWAFESRASMALPEAWVLAEAPSELLATLDLHGIPVLALEAPARARVLRFLPSKVERARRPFQGHHELALEGGWVLEERELPARARLVPGRHPLARVAAQLLEPESEDSLATWNFLDAQIAADSERGPGRYPIWRVLSFEDPPRTLD